jgi:hypothetical protein
LGVSEEEVLEYLISIADELLTFSTVEARKTNSSESDPYVGWQTETVRKLFFVFFRIWPDLTNYYFISIGKYLF